MFVDPTRHEQKEIFVIGINGLVTVEQQNKIAALAHEIAHATDYAEGITSIGATRADDHRFPSYLTAREPSGGVITERTAKREHEAVAFENIVRRELRQKPRAFYAFASGDILTKVMTCKTQCSFEVYP